MPQMDVTAKEVAKEMLDTLHESSSCKQSRFNGEKSF